MHLCGLLKYATLRYLNGAYTVLAGYIRRLVVQLRSNMPLKLNSEVFYFRKRANIYQNGILQEVVLSLVLTAGV
jgi:hypothetical protein